MIEAEVLKRGTGDNKRIRVKMLDGSKMKGYISQSGEDSFTGFVRRVFFRSRRYR
jgi:hypothetical protein